jgi:hypothetical protein
MITTLQKDAILRGAYVPEHSVGLMIRVSGAEPFLIEDHFCCVGEDRVIVVGYPLERGFRVDELERVFGQIIRMFRPSYVSLIAPELPHSICLSCRERESDRYYTLDLRHGTAGVRPKRAVMKAMEHVTLETAKSLSRAHRDLAEEFLYRVNPPARVRELLFKMWDYIDGSDDSVVLNAWSHTKQLAAFYVVDLAPKDFSTYVIGCHSKRTYIKHVSDVLFWEMIRVSLEHGKEYVHLGLGVNEGIRRFKKKWGAIPGLPYEMCELVLRKPSFLTAITEFVKK